MFVECIVAFGWPSGEWGKGLERAPLRLGSLGKPVWEGQKGDRKRGDKSVGAGVGTDLGHC